MNEPVADPDAVFGIARDLLTLQERLARLEEEKAAVQVEIAGLMGELTRRAVDAVRPAAGDAPAAPKAPAPPTPSPSPRYPSADPRTLAGMLLGHLARNPSRAFKVDDLASELEMKGHRAKTNIRAMLSRLTRRGQITRGDYGKYTAKAME